ncbi:DUF4136 domain-containing protein [Reichenbachiella carrageenanivorans]|uniref:DUF4136 domain-containing protein n=1 Tax=Reichenbachiella carrageenanivorans TaxID=2979869 RepID=A0ABY6CZB2_9BACT|nr:DUF4136 domain-containing protein [Reichenbachiella carrageenanivorans]UXX78754.1 DUF4136 domain-containing protein [Reichenbachiella carrageenanivorans]
MIRPNSIRPKNYLLFAVMIFLGSCLSQKDFITDSDYSYGGKFKKYRTYNFMTSPENDTLFHREILEKTIASRMGAQGYFKETKKPDLLVMYKIFYDDFSLRGYNQPHFESWVGAEIPGATNEDSESGDDFFDDEEVKGEEYRVSNYEMNDGTLLVVFFDRKKKQTVWQGYASGVFAKDNKDARRNIKVATSKIFNEFRLIADGYVIKGG